MLATTRTASAVMGGFESPGIEPVDLDVPLPKRLVIVVVARFESRRAIDISTTIIYLSLTSLDSARELTD